MADSHCTLEATLEKASRAINDCAAEKYAKCEESIRTAPVASVLFAAAAGYILHLLPVGRILGGLIKLVLVSIKPAVFIFGVWKIVDYTRSQYPVSLAPEEPGRDPVIDSPVGPA